MENAIALPVREASTWIGLLAFFASAIMAGAAVGAIISGVGDWMLETRENTAALVPILALVLLDAVFGASWAGHYVRPPSLGRQVSAETLAKRWRGVTGASWGFQIGAGVVTRVNTWSVWAMLAAFMATANPGAGLIFGGLYGAVRGVQPWLVAMSRGQRRSVAVAAASWDRASHGGPVVAAILLAAVLAMRSGNAF